MENISKVQIVSGRGRLKENEGKYRERKWVAGERKKKGLEAGKAVEHWKCIIFDDQNTLVY